MTLEELAKLCEGATPGPWIIGEAGDTIEWDSEDGEFGFFACDFKQAPFIAASRTYLPLLIKVAEAAKNTAGARDVELLEALAALERGHE